MSTRKPWLAGFFSFLISGLGQLYNGQATKAVAFYSWFLAINILLAGVVVNSLWGAAIAILVVDLSVKIFIIVDAVRFASRLPSFQLKPYNRWYLYVGLIFVTVWLHASRLSLRAYTYAYIQKGHTMENTIQAGDRVLTNKVFYEGFRLPFSTVLFRRQVKRGDVVVFQCPPAALSETEREQQVQRDFMKRVVGIPGDDVQIKDKRLYINGVSASDPYAVSRDSQIIPRAKVAAETGFQKAWERGQYAQESQMRDNFGPIQLGANDYFVLGDNRDESYDSRFWGPASGDLIKGKIVTIYWSRSKIVWKTHRLDAEPPHK